MSAMIRSFDILLSAFLLVILAPLLIVIAIIIKITTDGKIFFKQLRTGKYGQPFTLYKFQTMNKKTDHQGHLLPDHLRLSTLGRFLRQYSLDELPQLWNVLKGELSLVGPRPLLIEYITYYNPEQAKRLWIKPGITGWAQINGRNGLSWNEKFTLDRWYIDNKSITLYFKILFLTFSKVIRPEKIQQSSTMTMEKFKGNQT